jgi:hypothetical protein
MFPDFLHIRPRYLIQLLLKYPRSFIFSWNYFLNLLTVSFSTSLTAINPVNFSAGPALVGNKPVPLPFHK